MSTFEHPNDGADFSKAQPRRENLLDEINAASRSAKKRQDPQQKYAKIKLVIQGVSPTRTEATEDTAT